MSVMPNWINSILLAGFVRERAPLSMSLVAAVWRQCSLSQVRPDYALFHILYLTDNLNNISTSMNNFGGGPAPTMEQGVTLALCDLAKLRGEWHHLPADEYQGVMQIEQEFLIHVGMAEKKIEVSFLTKLAGMLGVLNGGLWVLSLFLPEPFLLILHGVIKYGADALVIYPHWFTAVLISLMTTTHALALRSQPPKWTRPEKSGV